MVTSIIIETLEDFTYRYTLQETNPKSFCHRTALWLYKYSSSHDYNITYISQKYSKSNNKVLLLHKMASVCPLLPQFEMSRKEDTQTTIIQTGCCITFLTPMCCCFFVKEYGAKIALHS